MKIEIGCAAGTIRLSDSRMSLNIDAGLDDILADLVGALRAVTGEDPVKTGNTLGSFGFQPMEIPVADDEPEEDE